MFKLHKAGIKENLTAGLFQIDLQGLELYALKGARTVLRGQRERKLPALPGTDIGGIFLRATISIKHDKSLMG